MIQQDLDTFLEQFECVLEETPSKIQYFDKQSLQSESMTEIQNNDADQELYKSICIELYQQKKSSRIQTSVVRKKSDSPEKKQASKDDPTRIIMQGYLSKKVSSFFSHWKKVFCLLTTQKLYCFDNQCRQNLLSCINFQMLSFQIQEKDLEILIKIQKKVEPFVLKGQNAQEINKWCIEFKRLIKLHSEKTKLIFRQLNHEIYEQKDAVTQKQFCQIAQTGDILLAKTQNSSCAFQRLITHSNFDHVAIILKFACGQVKIFEANENQGVNVYDWNIYLTKFNDYEQLCFRKLYHIQKRQLSSGILKFVKQTIGRHYDLGAIKLLRKTSQCQQNQAETSRGYFCSELVAKTLKSINLLDQKLSSARYWPIDFTDRGAIILKDGACFGQHRLVIQNKHLIHNN